MHKNFCSRGIFLEKLTNLNPAKVVVLLFHKIPSWKWIIIIIVNLYESEILMKKTKFIIDHVSVGFGFVFLVEKYYFLWTVVGTTWR